MRDKIPLPVLPDFIADKFVKWVGELAHEVSVQPRHPFHAKFRVILDTKITALKTSPECPAKGEQFKQHLLESEVLRNYVSEAWKALEQWIQSNLAKPESEIRSSLELLVRSLAEALKNDPNLWD